MVKKKISDFQEVQNVNGNDLILLMQDGVTKKAPISLLKTESTNSSSTNLTSANGTEYALTVSNFGELIINRVIPIVTSGYEGLIINQVYGGGLIDDGATSVSHSFIELYNTTENDINLNGLSVQYSEINDIWIVIPLNGVIPSKTSYLIRGARHNQNALIKIDEYDLDLEGLAIYNKGIKVLLCSNTTQCTVNNPYKNRVSNYIDMIGCGEFESDIDGGEIVPAIGQSKQKSIRRVDFTDTQHNQFDCEIVDFRLTENQWKKPRSLSYGAWSGQGIQIPSMQEYEESLKILQVYGGGSSGSCSHHFVELYNNHETKTMPLDGITLFGASYKLPEWQAISLTGSIPPKHSFLIRGGACTGGYILQIPPGDIECALSLEKAMKVFLVKTNDINYLTGIPNPFSHQGSKVEGYIDGFGCHGNSGTVGGTVDVTDGYEGEPPCGGDPGTVMDSFGTGGNSKNNAMRRRNLIDTDNNARDFEVCRYLNMSIEPTLYDKQPRFLSYGAWEFGSSFDKETTEPQTQNFIHITDTQADTEAGFDVYKNALTVAINSEKPNFVVHTGDLIEDTGDNASNWNWFKTKTNEVLGYIPLYTTRGNNDLSYDGKFTYPNSYENNANAYWFEKFNTLFICIDSESDLTSQKVWANDLLANTTMKWKVILIHRSPYTSIKEDTFALTEIFDNNKVDLVLCGHKHMYMRSYRMKNDTINSSGTMYIMGNPLGTKTSSTNSIMPWMEVCISPFLPSYNNIEITETNIIVTAYKIENSQPIKIDEVVIEKVIEESPSETNYIITSNGDTIVTSDGYSLIHT